MEEVEREIKRRRRWLRRWKGRIRKDEVEEVNGEK
jgi:hypothetical protein